MRNFVNLDPKISTNIHQFSFGVYDYFQKNPGAPIPMLNNEWESRGFAHCTMNNLVFFKRIYNECMVHSDYCDIHLNGKWCPVRYYFIKISDNGGYLYLLNKKNKIISFFKLNAHAKKKKLTNFTLFKDFKHKTKYYGICFRISNESHPKSSLCIKMT